MADQTTMKPLGPWGTAALQAGNGAFLGYLPQIVEYLPGGKEGDAQRVEELMRISDAENPKASWLGFGAGLIGPGAVGKRVASAGYKMAAPVVGPAVSKALGLAANSGNMGKAWAATKAAGGALAAGLGGYALFGGDSGTAPAPAEGSQQKSAAEQKAVGTQQAEPRKADWYDEMSGVTGLSRDTLKGMVQQEGGIRLSTLQTLNGMKGRTPSPQQQAISRLDNMFAGQIAQARASGDAQRSRELETLYSQIMAGVATSDDMIGSEVARVLNGE